MSGAIGVSDIDGDAAGSGAKPGVAEHQIRGRKSEIRGRDVKASRHVPEEDGGPVAAGKLRTVERRITFAVES